MAKKYGVRASGSSKFITGVHFILSDVNASFLRNHGIVMTITEFKNRVRNSPAAFKVEAGNVLDNRTQFVNVYDINALKIPRASQ